MPVTQDGVGVQRPFDAARHAGQRRVVEDAVHAADGLATGGRIGNVPLDELDPILESARLLKWPVLQVVEHSHPIAARDQRLGNVRADEAGCRR